MRSSSRARPHKTPAERVEILRAYGQTVLSAHRFAREHGIAPSTLFRWRRLGENPTRPDRAEVIEVPNLLVPPHAAPAYCLRFAHGVSLEVGSGFKPEELRALVEIVRGL